jgi:hypothetical protein
MKQWLSGTRGAILLIAMWTIGWGLGFGGLAELFVDPDGEIQDIWPAELAIPGFVGGVVLVLLLQIGERRRRLDEVSLTRFSLWGAATGLVLGVLSTTTGGPIPLSLTALEMIGLATGLGTVAGFGSAVFFQLVTRDPSPTAARRAG